MQYSISHLILCALRDKRLEQIIGNISENDNMRKRNQFVLKLIGNHIRLSIAKVVYKVANGLIPQYILNN